MLWSFPWLGNTQDSFESHLVGNIRFDLTRWEQITRVPFSVGLTSKEDTILRPFQAPFGFLAWEQNVLSSSAFPKLKNENVETSQYMNIWIYFLGKGVLRKEISNIPKYSWWKRNLFQLLGEVHSICLKYKCHNSWFSNSTSTNLPHRITGTNSQRYTYEDIFYSMGQQTRSSKPHSGLPPVFLYIKFYWNPVKHTCLHNVCGCFCTVATELSSCKRLCGPQSWKCLLSGPLWKSLLTPALEQCL